MKLKMMMYNSILARSFSRHEQKKLRYGALIGCLLVAFSFCTVLKPCLGPLPVLNLRLSMGVGLKMRLIDEQSNSQKIYKEASKFHEHISLKNISNSLQVVDEIKIPQKIIENTTSSQQLIVKNTSNSQQMVIKEIVPKKGKPICNIMKRTDFCEINNEDIRIDGSSSTVFIASSQLDISAENQSWTIRPYARKGDQVAMNLVKEWSVKLVNDPEKLPQCTQNHSSPAILFSNGGYAGNHFHDFTDIVIPLYLTSSQFSGEVQFLITNKQSWWIKKFQKVVKNLSKYDPIDIDREKDVHCFTSGIIGLKRHHDKELHIDPSLSTYSMKDFRQFMRNSYSLKKDNAIKMRDGEKKRPRLLIVSRKRSRTFTNIAKIAQMARRMGFEVVVAEADMNVSRFAEIVNSCDVLLGVHGAGLTNIVFLPENAVFIQVVPFGEMGWLARTDFEEPSKDMNLRYLEYKIKVEESTLIQRYPTDHQVLRDPASIGKRGWNAFKSVYMDKQNVELDLNRFRGTFSKALELLR